MLGESYVVVTTTPDERVYECIMKDYCDAGDILCLLVLLSPNR